MLAKESRKTAILPFCMFCSALCMAIAMPAVTAEAVRQACKLCAVRLLPSLFACMVAARFFTESGADSFLSHVFRRPLCALFACSERAGAILLCGMLSGFPCGAVLIRDAYRAQQIDNREAAALAGLANLPSPGFFIALIGSSYRARTMDGVLLLLCHWFAVCLSAPLFLHQVTQQNSPCTTPPAQSTAAPLYALCNCIGSAGAECLRVTAFVSYFSVLLATVQKLTAALLPTAVTAFVLELTAATQALHQAGAPLFAYAACCGFSGSCTMAQVRCVLPSEISLRPYLFEKLLHALLCPMLIVAFTCSYPAYVRGLACIFPFALLLLRLCQQKRKSLLRPKSRNKLPHF